MLREAVLKYGPKNWKKIAEEIGGQFTADQCNQHWHRVLNPRIIKGDWTPAEDDLLFERVVTHGESAWTKVAEGIPGRTDIQCRHRYFQRKKELEQGVVRNKSSVNDYYQRKEAIKQIHTQEDGELKTGGVTGAEIGETSNNMTDFEYTELNNFRLDSQNSEPNILQTSKTDEVKKAEEAEEDENNDDDDEEEEGGLRIDDDPASAITDAIPETSPDKNQHEETPPRPASNAGPATALEGSSIEDETMFRYHDEDLCAPVAQERVEVRLREDHRGDRIACDILVAGPGRYGAAVDQGPSRSSIRVRHQDASPLLSLSLGGQGPDPQPSINRMRGNLNIYIPWCEAEESTLRREARIAAIQGRSPNFEQILISNRVHFHPLRTTQQLRDHYAAFCAPSSSSDPSLGESATGKPDRKENDSKKKKKHGSESEEAPGRGAASSRKRGRRRGKRSKKEKEKEKEKSKGEHTSTRNTGRSINSTDNDMPTDADTQEKEAELFSVGRALVSIREGHGEPEVVASSPPSPSYAGDGGRRSSLRRRGSGSRTSGYEGSSDADPSRKRSRGWSANTSDGNGGDPARKRPRRGSSSNVYGGSSSGTRAARRDRTITVPMLLDEREPARRTGLYQLPAGEMTVSSRTTIRDLKQALLQELEVAVPVRVEISMDEKILDADITLEHILNSYGIDPSQMKLTYRSRN
eukprot:gb/GECH01000302.1/.p1 GENE.gb/GECH01000302.1/~~gb/GECH01000302.1/.p1  ORF type:complete len:694 (+),score=145.38 gb/GECH01000302.1/:1-2082(+)